MIERYSRPEMAGIWKDRVRYLTWLKVETVVCEELARQKVISRKDWSRLRPKLNNLIKKGGVNPSRVLYHERKTRHDIIAFTTAVSEKIGPLSRYVHFGLTSSDVLDTSLSILIQDAGSILLSDIRFLLKTLKTKANQFRNLPTIGRSHGIFAEPTSFGLKFLGWYAEWERNLKRLEEALERNRVGKISGAVGVNAHFSPVSEKKMLSQLKLKREPVSTQVIPRDRHAELIQVLAICGCSLERMAVEIRHLQRSEVGELQEGFRKGQKGSSAMPHKRNPISSENISGCARLLRSYAQASLENIVLWHERDISHSSVERVILPDATILLDYALARMNRVITELVVKKERVKANLNQAGSTVFSGHVLLALVQSGVTREKAYQWVQSCALASFEGNGQFTKLLAEHPEIKTRLSRARIKKLGSVDHQLRHVPQIFRSVLGKKSGQATTEYVVLLAIAVSLVIFVNKIFLKPMFERFRTEISKNIEDRFLNPKGLHQITLPRVGPPPVKRK